MIIDKNGKLFGKVSIIDLIILILVVLMVTFVVKKTGIKDYVDKGDYKDLEIEFYQQQVNDYTVKTIKKGDKAKETSNNISFGVVENIDIDEAVSWSNYIKDGQDELKPIPKEGYNSVKIKMLTRGKTGENGLEIDGKEFFIGDTIRLQVGKTVFYGEISGMVER